MRFLQRSFSVQTRYGGGFVQSINGLAGDYGNGHRLDWFYYVNGIEASKGAAAFHLHGGDRVWWDRHDWSAAHARSRRRRLLPGAVRARPRGPAPAGPAPVSGRRGPGLRPGGRAPAAPPAWSSGGRALNTETDSDTLRVAGRGLAGAAVRPGGQPARGGSGAQRRLRALRGPRPGAGAARRLGRGAQRIAAGDGTGLVAATRLGDRAPTWVVAGLDAAGRRWPPPARSTPRRCAIASPPRSAPVACPPFPCRRPMTYRRAASPLHAAARRGRVRLLRRAGGGRADRRPPGGARRRARSPRPAPRRPRASGRRCGAPRCSPRPSRWPSR